MFTFFKCSNSIPAFSRNFNPESSLYFSKNTTLFIPAWCTNLLHSLSYPLTGHYGISHGTALGYFLPKISELMNYDVSDIVGDIEIDLDIDIDFVIDEALKYNKIYEVDIFIDRKTLQEVLA